MTKFFGNVVALPDSGRDATTAFTSGTGDVLLSYENEAILARQSGPDFDYVIPRRRPCSSRTRARCHRRTPPTAAKEFLDFQKSDGRPEAATPRPASARSSTSVDLEVEGANDPSRPVPGAGQAAHHRR